MKRIAKAFAVLGLIGLPIGLPSPAQAATDCEMTVVDFTTNQSLDVSQLQPDIVRLQQLGADLRIRTYTNDVDGYWFEVYDDYVARCPSWSVDGANLNPNLIVFILTSEGNLVNVGPAWYDKISEDDQTHIHEVMLNYADDTEAIEAALGETIDQLDGLNANDPVVVAPGVGASALGLVGLIVWRRRVRKARRRAQSMYGRAVEVIADIAGSEPTDESGPGRDIMRDFTVVRQQVSPDDAKLMEVRLGALNASIAEVMVMYQKLGESGRNDPNDSHSISDYYRIANEYDDVARNANDVWQQLEVFKQWLKQLQQVVDGAESFLEVLKDRSKQLRRELAAYGTQGKALALRLDMCDRFLDNCSPDNAHRSPVLLIDTAGKIDEIDKQRTHLVPMSTHVSDLAEGVRALRAEADGLDGKHGDLQKRIKRLAGDVDTLVAEVNRDKPLYDQVERLFEEHNSELVVLFATVRDISHAQKQQRQQEQARQRSTQSSGATGRGKRGGNSSSGGGWSIPRGRSSSRSSGRRSSPTRSSSPGRGSSGSGGRTSTRRGPSAGGGRNK